MFGILFWIQFDCVLVYICYVFMFYHFSKFSFCFLFCERLLMQMTGIGRLTTNAWIEDKLDKRWKTNLTNWTIKLYLFNEWMSRWHFWLKMLMKQNFEIIAAYNVGVSRSYWWFKLKCKPYSKLYLFSYRYRAKGVLLSTVIFVFHRLGSFLSL